MIRVILDFSCIQHQLDKYVWFAVDTLAFSSIKCLKESVCNKFNLADIQFYVKDALLRDEDTVLLLRDEDVVKILQRAGETFAPSNYLTSLPKRSSKKRRMSCSFDFPNEEEQSQTVTNNILSCQESQVYQERVPKKKKKHRKKDSDSEALMPLDKEKSYIEELDQINLSPKCISNEQVEYVIATSPPEIKIMTSTDEVSDKKNDSFMEVITNNNNDSQDLMKQADIKFNGITINSTSQDLTEQVGIDSSKSSKCRKRKRRRRRKRKESLNQSDSVVKSESLENSQDVKFIKKAEIIPKILPFDDSLNLMEDKGRENKHIKFPESSDDSDSTEENTEAAVVEFNSLLQTKNISVSLPVSSTPQKPHLSCNSEELKNNNPEKYNLDDQKASSKFFKVSSAQNLTNSHSATKNEVKQKKQGSSEKSKYAPLHIPPIVGAHIAYKMLELDAMYCPVVSDYKEGVVKKINQVGNIEIELFQEEIKKSRCGKFEVAFDDCEPESEIIKIVSVNWSSMIDPQTINT